MRLVCVCVFVVKWSAALIKPFSTVREKKNLLPGNNQEHLREETDNCTATQRNSVRRRCCTNCTHSIHFHKVFTSFLLEGSHIKTSV